MLGTRAFLCVAAGLATACSLQTLEKRSTTTRQKKSWADESRELGELSRSAAVDRSGDVAGGLLWLEHLNIVVGDRSLAERFYFEEGLGCTRDPAKPGGPGSTGTVWANIGAQQFHLAEQAYDDPPQAVRGSIGLALPDPSAASERLRKIEGVSVEVHSTDRFTVRCPWGNVFHCYDVDSPPGEKKQGPKMVTMHAGDSYDGKFDVRGAPGIRFVHFACSDAPKAASRYATHFGSSPPEDDAQLTAVAAGVGPVHLIFETAEPDPEAEARQMGVHACFYVDDFAKRYADLREFIFTNPRFKHLDTCDTLQEALDSRTFRFAFPEIPNLEHETRALSHKNFMKPIAYRRPE